MQPTPISRMDLPDAPSSKAGAPSSTGGQNFDSTLEAAILEHSPTLPGPLPAPKSPVAVQTHPPASTSFPHAPINRGPTPGTNAAAAYQQQSKPLSEPAPMTDIQKYKDDQLLRNPGGRHYYLDQKKVVEHPPDQQSFFGRIKKDVSDSLGNIKNFFGNLFLGSTVLYRDKNNEIRETRQKGLVATVGNILKDIGSALSFGLWHPDEPEAPQGFVKRLAHSASKLKDAFMAGILEGIPSSVNHMGKNLILAGWNLIEVLPDATIGNFEAGRKLATTVFDNGQVAVEYLSDVLPSGDAWLRVHASNLMQLKVPVVYNLKMPENYSGDTRWEYVRNTPFRKSIETVGSLLADGIGLGLMGQSGFSSNRRHQIK